ncbi:MAG: hypothetical protein Q8N99_06525 [Nanoarchaeota archaeon]|nr:hypothetical protein [Nanoarchaeota archaeon]
MDFQEFLEKQSNIYSSFIESIVRTSGIEPKIPKNQGAYLIAFRHPEEITERVARFSNRIADALPAIVYDKSNVHTSIFVYGLKEDFNPDADVLDNLNKAVKGISRQVPKIDYRQWLYNRECVIVEGIPDKRFLDIAIKIKSSAEVHGLELKLPWGAHITASRFKEPRNPDELGDFFKLMSEAPLLGESRPVRIGIGYFNISPNGFLYKVLQNIELK